MKYTLSIFALALAVQLSAQSADTSLWRYADLTYPLGGFNSKSKVIVDFGENTYGWFKKADMLEDSTGKQIKFKSPVDALNWMSERGWELVQSYQTNEIQGLATNLYYQHFIMRRLEQRRRP